MDLVQVVRTKIERWIGFSCIGKHPTSLLAQAIKAKYYPDCDFLHALLGTYPSYFWESIWVVKGLLHLGFGWHVGDGAGIRVWDDVWIPDLLGRYLHRIGVSSLVLFVLEFINSTTRQWQIGCCIYHFLGLPMLTL